MITFSEFIRLDEGREFNHEKPHMLGSELPKHLQDQAKRVYVHRHTGDHATNYDRVSGHKPLYKNDAEWLAHTKFNVTKKGKLANASCYSTVPKRQPKPDKNGQFDMFGEMAMFRPDFHGWNNERENDGGTYKVVRHYRRGGRKTIATGVSLSAARSHCQNPETSSATCTKPAGKRHTRLHGDWSDSYHTVKPGNRTPQPEPPKPPKKGQMDFFGD